MSVHHIQQLNIDLVQINTAFLTGAGLPGLGADERKLIVPEYALHEAREHLTEGSYRIYCTHHPLAMLNESSAKVLENELNKYSDLHLFGHMHDPQPRSSIGLRGSYVGSQSGAIFTSRHNSYNGYSLLTIDRRSKFVECLLRSFFDERQAYDEAIDLIPGGIWYSSPESRAFFKEVATPIDIGQFKTHLAGDALDSLVQRECSGASDGDIHEKFVAPPLKRPFIQERPDDDGNVEFEIDLSFDSLVSAGNTLIV